MTQPKVLFLDWNKTLSYSHFWEQCKTPEHPLYSKFNLIDNWLFREHYDLIDKWMLGKLNSEEICSLLSEVAAIPQETLLKELSYSCQNMRFVDPEIPDLIKQIKSKSIEVVIATDNMDTFQRFTIPGMQLENLFDSFLISAELGMYKYTVDKNTLPFFDQYLKNKKLTYKDVVLLDDSIEKTGTFEQLGFEIKYNTNADSLLKLLTYYAT